MNIVKYVRKFLAVDVHFMNYTLFIMYAYGVVVFNLLTGNGLLNRLLLAIQNYCSCFPPHFLTIVI